MLEFDLHTVGNRLLVFRKRAGLTQVEVAEAAGLSDRTYADIERGTVNMRIDTLLKICQSLHITPNDILVTQSVPSIYNQVELMKQLDCCTDKEKENALRLLSVYLDSL